MKFLKNFRLRLRKKTLKTRLFLKTLEVERKEEERKKMIASLVT